MSHTRLGRWLLAIGCVVATQASAVGGELSPLVRGAQLLTQARPKAALREFAAAVEEDPTCAEARVGLGAAYLHLGDSTKALDCFNQALEANKTSRPARLGVASALFLDGEYDKALPQYRYCLAFDCSERSAVRAAAACSACLLGLYEAAEAEASLALRDDPSCELARIVAGAAWVARDDPQRAVDILQARVDSTAVEQLPPRFALVASSPLFSPHAHYFVSHKLSDEERLAFLGRGATAGAGPLPPLGEGMEVEAPTYELPESLAEGFRITRPRPGSLISGTASVVLEIPEDLPVTYVALLVDDEFRSMTNAPPFRLSVEGSRLAPGTHQIRVDGYGPNGERVGTAAVLVSAGQPRERTLSYEEQVARRSVSDQLEHLLVIRAPAGGRCQLLGHALRQLGRLDDAVEAFEEAFCAQPTAPGIRADLLTAYRDQGLRVGTQSREVHTAPDARQVCLTFDDGPHPIITSRILDLLDQYSVKATFFLVGKQVELYPELAAEIVRRGHEVGSHSYSHSNLQRFPKVYVERELVKSRAAIRRATGRTVTLFRPPGGNYDQDVRDAAAETGYTTVFWTSNIGNCPGWTPQAAADKFMAELTNGGIVLLHNGEDGSLEVLPPLLNALAKEQRLVGTVSALIEQPLQVEPLPGS
jgi:peptidoglycan/xylan/chitin deacetylase (PgdA/CDA1 family)/Flp pilus assembly protein TadD